MSQETRNVSGVYFGVMMGREVWSQLFGAIKTSWCQYCICFCFVVPVQLELRRVELCGCGAFECWLPDHLSCELGVVLEKNYGKIN